jgi:hypothetical protein
MPTIKQYRPGFFTGFENELKEFNSLDELFSLDFVDNFKKFPNKELDPKFHRFSISKMTNTQHEYPYVLMAEFKDGTEWWVVGYISENEITNQLPVWEAKKETK